MVLVGLAVLACLTVAIVAISGDDDGSAGGSTSTSATGPVTGGRAPDVVVAAQLLPDTLGSGWVEVSREADPVPAEVADDDPCAELGQPIQRGLVVRAAFDHLTQTVIEQASIVAGVIEEGSVVPRMDDPGVVDCFQAGLQPQLTDGEELVVVEQGLPPAPDGLELSGAILESRRDGTPVRRFELLLLRRDRAVVFALVVVADLPNATPVADLVAVLDAPLAAAAARLN